ncbi:hypothetical protein VV869_20655 [Photobacterium sp. MCCC 1A19761]|uniref:hypothetical protein n=1 Tax=Photobacterium sp. MCCC 1A19761 TaxID=3115000 RepID=UPI00307EEF7A
MTFVIQRARQKRLELQTNRPPELCPQSQQHSQQLITHFAEVVRHFSTDPAGETQTAKEKLAALYRHHEQCFDHQRVTGPGEQ